MAMRLSGLVSNMDTDAIIKELMSAQSMKKTKIENKKTKLEWKQDIWKEFNTKIYSLYTGSLSKMRMQSNYATKKASSTNDSALTATADSTATSGTHKVSISQLASAQYVTGDKVSAGETGTSVKMLTKLESLGIERGSEIVIKGKDKTETIIVSEATSIAEVVAKCQSVGLNASFDESQGRFFISSKKSGAENTFEIGAPVGDAKSQEALEILGLGANKSVVDAKDAKYTLNGAEMTSSTNTIKVNGLKLELKEITAGDITLTIANDTDEVYKMVKDFVKGYNELLEELNKAYYANTAKGYEPLTDEQKEAMTEDEIEKWEKKIKDSLLRRDDKLGSLLSAMKTTLSGSVNVGGKSYSLASFGIGSTLYTEKGKLHIDGDTEDSLVADNKEKLKAALDKDPDTVMQVLSTVTGNLYSTMNEKMKSSTLNSALTFYNDKEMKKTMTKYEKDIATMEKKLKDIENRYYAQFSAMETAMSKLNSQSSSLMSMLGQ